MSLQRSLTDIGFKVLNEAHRATLRLSGGRIGRTGYGMPVVELRTVGRKTGQTRATMLTSTTRTGCCGWIRNMATTAIPSGTPT